MMRDSVLANAPRMSLSALNVMEDQDRQVRIWLLGSTTIKGAVFYRIAGRFNASGQTWQVNRRYSEFLVLRDALVKYFSRTPDTCPGCLNYLHSIKQFDFPKKHLFVSKSQLVVNYRIQALRSFMNLLASWAFSNSPKCPTCGGFAFDIVRNFCLEGAEAVGDSNMSYIRDAFVVSTFTDAGRRSSLTRRNSVIPAFGSQTLNAQRRDQQQRRSDTHQQHRHTMAGAHADPPPPARTRHDEAAYDAFNDYLVRQPSQLSKNLQSRSTINIPKHRADENEPEHGNDSGSGGSSGSSRGAERAQTPHRASSETTAGGRGHTPQQSTSPSTHTPSKANGSFLLYQDGLERDHSVASSQRPSTTNGPSANGSQRRMPGSTGSRRGILKNWNDVRHDRAQNGLYTSLGAGRAVSHEAVTTDARYEDRSSGRGGARKNRSDARSENDSYFSLGASSSHSRGDDDDEYARASSKRSGQPSTQAHHSAGRESGRLAPYAQPLNDVRYDRSQNDSYLSLGASSTSGDLEEEYRSHHPSMLPSPSDHEAVFVQPPPTQKYVGGAASKKAQQQQHVRSPPPPLPSSQRLSSRMRSPPPPSSQRKSQRHLSPPPPPSRPYDEYDDHDQPRNSRRRGQVQAPARSRQQHVVDDSFATDSFVDESLRFDGMGPIAVDDVSDSDDEIDVTGLAIDARTLPRKSTSGEGLWQPWELAKAG